MKKADAPRARRGTPVQRQRWKPGAIVEIPVAVDLWAYAQLGEQPIAAVLQGVFATRPPLEWIFGQPISFKCWIQSDAVAKGYWIKVGQTSVRPDVLAEEYRFKQDRITGELALYHSDFAQNGWERPALLSECIGLECAAIWDTDHVEDRILAQYEGTECRWVKSMAIDLSRVPAPQNDLH